MEADSTSGSSQPAGSCGVGPIGFDGKEKLMSLGKYPDVSLALARERHSEARKLFATGVDPMAQRKAEKTAEKAAIENSFQSVAAQWLEHWQDGKSPRHVDVRQAAHGGRYSALPRCASHCGDRGAGTGGDGQRDSGSRRAGYCQTCSGDGGAGLPLRHCPRLLRSATRPARFAPATF